MQVPQYRNHDNTGEGSTNKAGRTECESEWGGSLCTTGESHVKGKTMQEGKMRHEVGEGG